MIRWPSSRLSCSVCPGPRGRQEQRGRREAARRDRRRRAARRRAAGARRRARRGAAHPRPSRLRGAARRVLLPDHAGTVAAPLCALALLSSCFRPAFALLSPCSHPPLALLFPSSCPPLAPLLLSVHPRQRPRVRSPQSRHNLPAIRAGPHGRPGLHERRAHLRAARYPRVALRPRHVAQHGRAAPA